MGSSSKKKKEKKKDFQKPKLRVGKAKPKPDNQTDTSFRAKAIVLGQQSLNVSAPSDSHQFQHHVSMLSSRSDIQRKESLSYLTNYVSSQPVDGTLPMPVGNFLDKVCPLILDGSAPVRAQTSKLLTKVRTDDLRDYASKLFPYIRAGMTHLSKEIRSTSIDLLSWLITSIGDELVSCSGGWQKTLESFVTLLNWRVAGDDSKWSLGKATFGNETKTTARVMQVLNQFLRCGMEQISDSLELKGGALSSTFPIWHKEMHRVPEATDAFLQLGLFGNAQSTGNQILEDYEDRIRFFDVHYRNCIESGISATKSEGGELGRAAGLLTKTLREAELSS